MRAPPFVTGLTIGLSAFLLFSIEPLSSRELLPRMGGSSAVWLTSLCFCQVALLLGYSYAALLVRLRPERLAGWLHVSALAAAVCWIALASPMRVPPPALAEDSPAWTIFALLVYRIGLPFLLLSATSPLLQVWPAQQAHRPVRFGLFGLSNAVSLLALLAYPTLIEPRLALSRQRTIWAAGFGLYALLCGWVVISSSGRSPASFAQQHATRVTPRTTPGQVGRWLLLSAVAAVQLCAVTSHLTENVAALPLLWVVPLGVYLLSFVVAFDLSNIYRREIVLRFLVVLLAGLGYLLSKTDVSLPLGLGVGFFLTELFLACWFCHAELYQLRPPQAAEATLFYLVLAAGGALGTAFSSLLAPLLFNANYDLPVAFAITAAAATLMAWHEGWSRRLLWMTSTILCVLLASRLHTAYAREAIFQTRNFYGSLRVKQTELPVQAESSRLLLHGTIEHGMQWFAPGFRGEPLTYYGRDSGVGRALTLSCDRRARTIGVIGLGAGTLAAYGRAGDMLRFYEINPAVTQIAKELFTYLRESKAAVTIVEGDARQSLEREGQSRFDVLVVDAFSGDAIPVHLLTTEAMRLYRQHLRADGVLAFHISNQYLDLAPVLSALAAREGLTARVVNSPADSAHGIFAARWVLLASPDACLLAGPDGGPGEPLQPSSIPAWTDDYSSLLPIVRWGGQAR